MFLWWLSTSRSWLFLLIGQPVDFILLSRDGEQVQAVLGSGTLLFQNGDAEAKPLPP